MASNTTMNPAIDVRRAVEADIPRILEIERESEAAAHFSEADYRQAIRSGAGESAAWRIVLIAETVQCVDGFLVARFLHEEWEIENVAVAKAARRLGFGATLVNAFLKSHFCSNNEMQISEASVKSVFLEVRESNLAARKLYEKLCFNIVGRRTFYYHQPAEDAIVYRYSFQ
jgi:ribosomal-protein-alanine N-acetyltransferase